MKVNVNGREVEATQIAFSTVGEPLAEYQLDNGKTLRIKTVLVKVFETAEKNPDGSTLYSFQTQTVCAVDEKHE